MMHLHNENIINITLMSFTSFRVCGNCFLVSKLTVYKLSIGVSSDVNIKFELSLIEQCIPLSAAPSSKLVQPSLVSLYAMTINNEVTIINPFGDLHLTITTPSASFQTFRVSSHSLMAASPFFARLLDLSSNFSEAVDFRQHIKHNFDTGLPFPLSIQIIEGTLSSCSIALKLISGTLHLIDANFSEREGFLGRLCDLVKVVEFWDCGNVVGGWAAKWFEKYLGSVFVWDEEGFSRFQNGERWLLAAYRLRNEGVFGRITARYVQTCTKREEVEGLVVHEVKTLDPFLELTIVPERIKSR